MNIIALFIKFFEENMNEKSTSKRYWATWGLLFFITLMFGSSALIVAISQLLAVTN